MSLCLTERLASTAEATTSLLRIGAIVTSKRPASSIRPMVQQSSNGSVVIALIDTGCDVTNTDLNVIGGMDFTSDSSYGLDGNGHGTHVAGATSRQAHWSVRSLSFFSSRCSSMCISTEFRAAASTSSMPCEESTPGILKIPSKLLCLAVCLLSPSSKGMNNCSNSDKSWHRLLHAAHMS